MSQLTSLQKEIEKAVKTTFEKVINDRIDQLVSEAEYKLARFAQEQKEMARKTANSMTLQIMEKVLLNEDGRKISVEFKI